MSSRALSSLLIPVLLVLVVAPAAAFSAFDWADFTARSDQGDDQFLVSSMETGDFETRAAICGAIGKRAEPDARAVLSWLLAGYSSGQVYQAELLLRMALASLFEGPSDDVARAERASANADILSDIARSISGLKDPQLRGTVIRLLPRLDRDVGRRALMETGVQLFETLRRSGGRLSPQEISLARDYLQVVTTIGNKDFLDPCLELARLSRDRSLVTAARSAAASISSAQR